MVVENVLINIKTVANLKQLVQTNRTIAQLRQVGVNVNNGLREMNGQLMNTNKAAKRATPIFQRFRMELLSVMFGGMMLQKMMFGLLQNALKNVGIFQLWGETLGLFFLPFALQLLDVLLPIMGWLMDASPVTKTLVGWFVALVGVLGTLLATFAAFGLFLFGLQTALINLAVFGATPFGASLLALLGPIALLIAGIIAFSIGLASLVKWFKDNRNAMADWTDEMRDKFDTWKEDFLTKWKELETKLPEPIRKASEMIRGIFTGITDAFSAMLKFISDKLRTDEGIIGANLPTLQNQLLSAPEFTGRSFLKDQGFSGAGTTNTFSPTINVSASSNVDIDLLKSQLSTQWNDDFARMSRGN